MTHCLKTKPKYFNAILSGLKTFELRKSDRNYHINDELILAEYDTTFTGRKVSVMCYNKVVTPSPQVI